ncbi:TMV resistance protein N [Morella rubra]|uniref:TMV resistance protein N n=1 Tax=Morella rubra TaxID=262757 RepID=A0A6A1UGT2_9ROSI|nr:TMV resistance protein N [Morella rubra]
MAEDDDFESATFCGDPSDVRKQTGTFEKAFDKHAKNPETESWRTALTEVGNIAGWDLRNRPQAIVIRQIVGDIFEKLSLRISSAHEELVGIDSPVMEMMDLIGMGLNDVRFIGIHGMAGVGKTTLSQVIYDNFSHQFEGSSYLASVRESSGNQGLVCLQQKLLCQILKEREVGVRTVTNGATMIRNRMQHKKILIVLDDVNTNSQLEALAGSHDCRT